MLFLLESFYYQYMMNRQSYFMYAMQPCLETVESTVHNFLFFVLEVFFLPHLVSIS